MTVFVCEMDLALMIFLAESIKVFLSVNIVIMGIVLFGIYCLLRGVIEMKDEDIQ